MAILSAAMSAELFRTASSKSASSCSIKRIAEGLIWNRVALSILVPARQTHAVPALGGWVVVMSARRVGWVVQISGHPHQCEQWPVNSHLTSPRISRVNPKQRHLRGEIFQFFECELDITIIRVALDIGVKLGGGK